MAQREYGRAELAAKLASQLARAAARSALADSDGRTAADAGALAEQAQLQVASVLDELEHCGLLSDARATDAVVHAKASRYGVRRLRQTLQARALPAELIDEALRGTHATEFARACEVWRRRFGVAPADARERARQMRFLLARGFEAAVVQRVIRRSGEDDDDAPDDDSPRSD